MMLQSSMLATMLEGHPPWIFSHGTVTGLGEENSKLKPTLLRFKLALCRILSMTERIL